MERRPSALIAAASVTLAALLVATISAAEERAPRETEWLIFAPVGALVPLLPSADPDEPALRIGIEGARREAMAGARLLLFGVRSAPLDFGFEAAGFVALENFTEESAMPWELVRASLSVGTIWRSAWVDRRILPRDGQLLLELGFVHESDHAVAEAAYRAAFLTSPWTSFDNGNFSAYEHLRARLRYQQAWLEERVVLLVAIGGRYFTPSINPGDRRALRFGTSAEARLEVRIVSRLFAFLGVFYELVGNDFVASAEGFAGDLDHDFLHFLVAETGLAWRSTIGHVAQLGVTFDWANGRGLDFPVRRTEWGFGFRFLL